MIHIFIGTKAQYIKTAPVIRELERRGIGYNLIDSGQHAELQEKFRDFLDIRKPDVMLREGCQDITNPAVLMHWLLAEGIKGTIFVKNTKEKLFRKEGGVCLIHGDTPTTLLSALIAKRCHLKIAHLEAGLRSYSLLNPFPEEIIRIIVMKMSDILFASSGWAHDNLKRMNIKGIVVPISANTGLDSLKYSMAKSHSGGKYNTDYCIVSIHRFERLARKKGLKQLVDLIERIAKSKKVLFPIHPPTKRFLERHRLLDRLYSINNVGYSGLYEHGRFLHLVNNADFIITDGGSIQEESYYLGVPCLILRSHTERQEGIGHNAVLMGKDAANVDDFLKNYMDLRRESMVDTKSSPSYEIVDFIVRYCV